MRALRQVAVLAVALVMAACGSEPTATRAPSGARHDEGTLSVSISGPTQVWAGNCNMWASSVSGGTPPYTYWWEGFDYQILDSTGGSLQAGFSSVGHYAVNLIVEDSNGNSGFAQYGVYSAPPGTRFVEPC